MKTINFFMVALMSLVTVTTCFADDRMILPEQLPAPAKAFIQTHYDGTNILFASKEYDGLSKHYEVHLNDGTQLDFDSKGNWDKLTLVPFYQIQHARYSCYWYAQTAEAYEQSDMGKADAAAAALIARTIDYVATGEQQSEAGHEASYSTNSSYGSYNGEFYRDASGSAS